MEILYQDLININGSFQQQDIRYHVRYKNESTACLEPPGACCCTPELQKRAFQLIEDYYHSRGMQVIFSDDCLHFSLKPED